MQYVTKDNASPAAFVAAGRVARDYIAACALVKGSVDGLLALAEGRYTRDQLKGQLLLGMGHWCWSDKGSHFLDLCVAIPSQRSLPDWAVKLRESGSDAYSQTILGKEKLPDDVRAQVDDLFSIVDSPIAQLMAKLRLPMGSLEGVKVSTTTEFQVAHLWLLSDFFHNMLPNVHVGAMPSALTSITEALNSEDNENMVLREGGDIFANSLAESFPTSNEAVNELAKQKKLKKQGEEEEEARFQLLKSLRNETVRKLFNDSIIAPPPFFIGRSVIKFNEGRPPSLHKYKLVLFSLTWIRVYNVTASLLYHIHALSTNTDGVEPLSDHEWTEYWSVLLNRFHAAFGIETGEDMMSVGTYGDPHTIISFHNTFLTLKQRVGDA